MCNGVKLILYYRENNKVNDNVHINICVKFKIECWMRRSEEIWSGILLFMEI